MTQKYRQLLLKDLCARLPYEVIVKDRNGIHKLTVGNTEFTDLFYSNKCNIKPYLRPMSSMTRKERSTYITLLAHGPASYIVAWLDANHFDHRVNKEGDSLIDLGLAIEVTKDNNPYKE